MKTAVPLVKPRRFRQLISKLAAVVAAVVVIGPADLFAAPSNDNIANAKLLSGSTAADTVDNTTATKEVGDFAEKTVWWKWTAPANGVATFDAVNSVPHYVKMAVYLRSGTGGLGGIVYISGASYSTAPKYVFPVAQGTTYMIGMGNSSTSDYGALHLGLSLDSSTSIGSLAVVGAATMSNDSFAQRITLSGISPAAICYNTSATTEAGEPSTSGAGTFWFTYRPSVNGRLTLTSQGSTAAYPEIAAYIGTTVSGLKLVSYHSSYTVANFTVPVTAGTDYQLSLGVSGTGNQSDALVLGLSLDTQADVSSLVTPVPATMSNDNFSGRITLVGDAVGAIAYNSSATTEAGEPSASGNATFWWTYRPSATGRLTITSQGSDIAYASVAVYQGTNLSSLQLAAGQANYSGVNFTFPVTANTDYQISFGTSTTFSSGLGSMVLGLSLDKNADVSTLNIPQSASATNDNFANRVILTGGTVSAIGYNLAATHEALEPTATGQRTLWWSWTSGASGTVQFDFTGTDSAVSSHGVLSVWQGTSVSSLTQVTVQTGLKFSAVAGQTYQIAVGTSSTSYGGSIVMTIFGSAVPAVITSPVSGSTLSSSAATFSWPLSPGVSGYLLWIGSAPGAYDIYAGNEGTNLSKTVTTLPNDGRTMYVTLYSLINGSYQSNAYTYTAWRAPQPQKAWLTSPANGSTLSTTSLPLAWSLGTGVTSCYLFVGTTSGGYDLYSGNQGTATSRTVAVPAGGGRVYVTLWSLINGAYKGNSYYFVTTPSVRAALSSPANGSTLTGNQLNLTWTQGTGVSQYYVYVGTSYGGYDIAAANAGTVTSRSITVPQTGAPVYVTIWSLINGGFQGNNYWFTTALPVSGNRAALVTSPANASTLGSATMNLAWDAGSGVTSYALWVGSTPGGYDLYSGLEGTSRTKQVVVPADGRRIYVTLHSLIGGAYQSASYWFTAATLPDGGAARIGTPTPGSTLGGASLALGWSPVAGATQYYLFVGRSPGANDLYTANEGAGINRTVSVPTDGRPVYTTLYSLINGTWKPSSAWFTTANTGGGNKSAVIISHANGSTLSGAANTFAWSAGSGVTAFALWIGSNPGGYDLWSSADGLNTSRAVNLPTDGRKLYVTLYSSIGGVWQGASYLYTAATQATPKAALASPANGATFTSTSQTFTWSAAAGATAYALWIGRTPGAYDVYAGAEGSNLSRTVTTLPNDGSPLYVTLYSFIGGVWQSNEYLFTAWLQP